MVNSKEVRDVVDKLLTMASETKELRELELIGEITKKYIQIYDFLIAKEKMDAVSYTQPIMTGATSGSTPKDGN